MRGWNIPNGIPAPTPVRPAVDARKDLGIPVEPGVKVIAQISSIVPYKGHMVLLEAARRVLHTNANVFFLLVGYSRQDPEYRQQVLTRIQELGIADCVAVHGYPGVIGDVWQLVDLQVHASLFDSLPNAILEGMALGVPAVVTSVGGIPDAVEHEKTGLVVPPGDPEALAQALLQLLNNPREAIEMGKAAKARHTARYTAESMAKSLENCYLSVIPSSH